MNAAGALADFVAQKNVTRIKAEIEAIRAQFPTVDVNTDLENLRKPSTKEGKVTGTPTDTLALEHEQKLAQILGVENDERRDALEIAKRTKAYEDSTEKLSHSAAAAKATEEVNSERAAANAVDQLKTQIAINDEAKRFADSAPQSTAAIRAEIEQIKTAMRDGVFNTQGRTTDAIDAIIERLTEVVKRTGDVKAAQAELIGIAGLTAEQTAKAAAAFKAGAVEFRTQKDEALGKAFRVDELQQDVKDAFHDGIETATGTRRSQAN